MSNEDEFFVEVGAATDTGTLRCENEDRIALHFEGNREVLIALADGISGLEAGEVASALAVEEVLDAFRRDDGSKSVSRRLAKAVQQANIAVFDKATVVPELRGMGTTLTAVHLGAGVLTVAHVGDCRVYLLRAGTLTQLTKDHTVVAERLRHAFLDEEAAKRHPHRSILTRSLGGELIVAVDVLTRAVDKGDTIVLCSDGLHNVLSRGELIAGLADENAAAACHGLISMANARGTPDNLTVSVARIRSVGPRAPAFPRWRSWLRR